MTKLLGSLAFAAMSVALTPTSVLAQEYPFQGSITVAYAFAPNTDNVSYCGGPALPYVVEAHGVGTSTLGFLSMTLQKTLAAVGPMHGCVTFTALNGDTLSATYDGTEGAPDAFNFQFGTGTLTFTGGTSQFRGASGKVSFKGTFSGVETGSYLFEGSVSFHN
jgi:hypothetical protein